MVIDKILFTAQAFAVHCICNVRKLSDENVSRPDKLDKMNTSTTNNRIKSLAKF